MTELGHGSNVMGIETTAEWEPESGGFVIHTPNDTASAPSNSEPHPLHCPLISPRPAAPPPARSLLSRDFTSTLLLNGKTTPDTSGVGHLCTSCALPVHSLCTPCALHVHPPVHSCALPVQLCSLCICALHVHPYALPVHPCAMHGCPTPEVSGVVRLVPPRPHHRGGQVDQVAHGARICRARGHPGAHRGGGGVRSSPN